LRASHDQETGHLDAANAERARRSRGHGMCERTGGSHWRMIEKTSGVMPVKRKHPRDTPRDRRTP
ncbi:MAG: hypothetical protein ACHRXM_31600, partial [Isosphaerales bacterium]